MNPKSKANSSNSETAPKQFTFGDLIVSAYNDRNKRRARAILRFAINARLVVFPGSHQALTA